MKLLLLACFVAAAHAASQYLRCDCNNEQAYGRDGRQLTVAGLTGYEEDTVICQEVCVAAIEEAARLFASNSLLKKRKKRETRRLPYSIPTGPSALPQSGGVAGIDGVAVPPGISVEAGPFNPYGHNPPPRHGPYHPGTIPGRGVPIGYFPSCNYDCVERCPPGAPCYFACQRHWTGRRRAPSRVARPIAPAIAARPVVPARPLAARPVPVRAARPVLAARPLPVRPVAPAVALRPLPPRRPALIRPAPLPVVPLAPRPAPLPVIHAGAPVAPMAAGPILPGPPIARSGPIFGHRNGIPTVTHIEYHRRPILARAPPPAIVRPAGPALLRPIKK